MTGITISTKQVEMATRLARSDATALDSALADQKPDAEGFLRLGRGKVRFIELDAEKMGDMFADSGAGTFDVVWICEALSHFPDKVSFVHWQVL